MQSVEMDPPRGFRRGLLIAVIVGALWRLSVLVFDKWNQQLLLNDSIYYSVQARQVAEGRWFREIFVDQPGAEHGPLTSLLLAPVSWVDDPLPWQRLLTMCFGIGTIVALGFLGRRVGGWRVGVAAAAIAAVYPNLWMNDGLVMSESLSMLLVTAVLLAAHRAMTTPGWRVVAVAGVLAGLATLARSELALLVPGLAAMLWFVGRPTGRAARRSAAATPDAGVLGTATLQAMTLDAATSRPAPVSWRERLIRPAVVVTAAVLVASPWVAFNLSRFERPVTLTTNDGTTLLGSYCDGSFSGPNMGGWSLFCVVDDPDYDVAEEPSVRSERQRTLAVGYARAHLTRLPVVVAARVGRSLDLYGLDSLVAQDVGEERYRWASWAGIVSWWALGVAALMGLRRIDSRTRWLLLLPCAAVAVTTIVFYGGHRIRSSMEPTVVIAAAVMIVRLLARMRPPPDISVGRTEA